MAFVAALGVLLPSAERRGMMVVIFANSPNKTPPPHAHISPCTLASADYALSSVGNACAYHTETLLDVSWSVGVGVGKGGERARSEQEKENT